MGRNILFSAFEMNSISPACHGLWRHPGSDRIRYKDLEFWLSLAKLLERGCFEMIFLADVLGMYDLNVDGRDTSVREAVQVPCNDPLMLIPAMAVVTEHLGFATTFSTSYEPPFPFARRMSTLDHLTRGRVAWNVVTSFLPSAARNFGLVEMIEHDLRYDRAEEYLDVCYKLWEGSWEDDAVLAGTILAGDAVVSSSYADPAKVHDISHSGEYFQVAGPHLAEPSPQRSPVLFQAGSSPRGRSFAGRHAECVFLGTSPLHPAQLQGEVLDVRASVTAAGRSIDDVKTFAGVSIVVDETAALARRKAEAVREWVSAEGVLSQVSGATGYDLSQYSPNADVATMSRDYQGFYVRGGAPRGMTVGQLKEATVRQLTEGQMIVGTPEDVADQLEAIVELTGIDGFNIGQSTPDTFSDIVELLVPELRRRGVYRREYPKGTLRERLFGANGGRLPDTHPAAGRRRASASINLECAAGDARKSV